MIGIVVNDFDSIIKKNEYCILDLNEKILNITNNCNELFKNISSSDLKFLTKKLEEEIQQFNNVKFKIESYQTALKNVLLSYIEEDEELTKNFSQIVP